MDYFSLKGRPPRQRKSHFLKDDRNAPVNSEKRRKRKEKEKKYPQAKEKDEKVGMHANKKHHSELMMFAQASRTSLTLTYFSPLKT